MMHLRVISPADETDRVLAALREGQSANVVVHRGAAIDPGGDVIIADIPRDGANDVIDRLKALDLHERGSIALDTVDVAMSKGTDAADRHSSADDAVIWDEIAQRTSDESRLSVTFLVFIVIATVIAAIGVLLDQPILIVGAMVVGPEFGPLAALCVGVIRRRPGMVGRAFLALSVGFAVAIAFATVAVLLFDLFGLVDREMALAERPLTGFIYQPDALSWVVGFLAGIAGMLSLTSAKSGALIGVLISVTTVPAAGNVAVAIAYRIPDEAWGSALQLGINLAAIVTGGLLTLFVQRGIAAVRNRRAARPTAARATE